MAQVGLNDLHFAILTKDTVEELIYETPEPIAGGAIEATINPAVDTKSCMQMISCGNPFQL